MQPIKPRFLRNKNNSKIITSGILNKIKGHEFTLKQISEIYSTLPIIGKITKESKFLYKLANKLQINIELLKALSYVEVQKYLKNYSIYLSNPNHEPFGIATLEATENNLYVIGKNEGGTPEIIFHGLNGFLYPNDILIAKKTLKSIYNKKELLIYKNAKIDWNYSVSRILSIYHHITHTPNE
jgi:glycosyltransferase involved in cell wall biosynthesis